MERGRVVAVGHVGLGARDLEGLARFYREVLGLKQSVYYPNTVAIFEVGDVDVFLAPGETGAADFDLSADDVDALRERLGATGLAGRGAKGAKRTGHGEFPFPDPDGNDAPVTTSHPA